VALPGLPVKEGGEERGEKEREKRKRKVGVRVQGKGKKVAHCFLTTSKGEGEGRGEILQARSLQMGRKREGKEGGGKKGILSL